MTYSKLHVLEGACHSAHMTMTLLQGTRLDLSLLQPCCYGTLHNIVHVQHFQCAVVKFFINLKLVSNNPEASSL